MGWSMAGSEDRRSKREARQRSPSPMWVEWFFNTVPGAWRFLIALCRPGTLDSIWLVPFVVKPRRTDVVPGCWLGPGEDRGVVTPNRKCATPARLPAFVDAPRALAEEPWPSGGLVVGRQSLPDSTSCDGFRFTSPPRSTNSLAAETSRPV